MKGNQEPLRLYMHPTEAYIVYPLSMRDDREKGAFKHFKNKVTLGTRSSRVFLLIFIASMHQIYMKLCIGQHKLSRLQLRRESAERCVQVLAHISDDTPIEHEAEKGCNDGHR